MPITSAPVDPARFTSLMFMSCEPKADRDTGVQFTSRDGTLRKWTVALAASKPATYDPSRAETDVLQVTVTSADDPADGMLPGTPVTPVDFTVGVMAPEGQAGDDGKVKIRGGRLYWQASGLRAAVGVK